MWTPNALLALLAPWVQWRNLAPIALLALHTSKDPLPVSRRGEVGLGRDPGSRIMRFLPQGPLPGPPLPPPR